MSFETSQDILRFGSFSIFFNKSELSRQWYIDFLDTEKIPLLPEVRIRHAKDFDKFIKVNNKHRNWGAKNGVDVDSQEDLRNFKIDLYKVWKYKKLRLSQAYWSAQLEYSETILEIYNNFKLISILYKEIKSNLRLPREEQILQKKLESLQLENRRLAEEDLKLLNAKLEEVKLAQDANFKIYRTVAIEHIHEKRLFHKMKNIFNLIHLHAQGL